MTETDTDLLNALEGYEFSVEYIGDEVDSWRARVRYTIRGNEYVYGNSPREVIEKAVVAFKASIYTVPA